MRKQADFHMVFHYKRVYGTFIGGKANECRLSHVHSPAVNGKKAVNEYCKGDAIAKSRQL